MSADQEWTPRVRRVDVPPAVAPAVPHAVMPNADAPHQEADERVQHAATLLREDRLNEARDELLAILQDDPKSVKARTVLGAVYLRQELHAEALAQLKTAIQIDALMIQAHLLAGTCYLRMGEVEQARAELRVTLDLNPNQVNAHVGMAQVLAQTGQLAHAIQHLEEALRLDPQMSAARMLMARLMSQAGDVDGAIEHLTTLIHIEPENAGASLQLAKMQKQKGNNEEAIELLTALATANPESAQAWNTLGRMKLSLKDYEGAEKAFTQAIELKTPDRATPLRLIDALIKQGKFDQAREKLQNVPRRGPMRSVVHRLYGDIYAAKELYDEAVESYRASILHMPDGDKTMAEIEAAAGVGATNAAKIRHFTEAFAKLQEGRRQAQDGGGAAGRRSDSSRPLGAIRGLAMERGAR